MLEMRAWAWTLVAALCLVACNSGDTTRPASPPQNAPHEGALVFGLNDSTTASIPGTRSADALVLHNHLETLTLNATDPGCWTVPVFSGTICLDSTGHGLWTDILRVADTAYTVPVQWVEFVDRVADFRSTGETGDWRLTFGTTSPWYGDLHVEFGENGTMTGTIETATGDFRHLHGKTDPSRAEWTLNTFDGAHLFHFSARFLKDSIAAGTFASGVHYSTPFTGHRLTSSDPPLSAGHTAQWTGEPVQYAAITPEGDPKEWVWNPTASDDTVHVISIMGSWCPNCLDEHRLLRSLMDEFPTLRVHSLAFERATESEMGRERARKRLEHYFDALDLTPYAKRWSIGLAGPASKQEAQLRLPFLDRVVSFPTTIVLHPNLPEPWIHSGFNGPATGAHYDLERARFAEAISGQKGNH